MDTPSFMASTMRTCSSHSPPLLPSGLTPPPSVSNMLIRKKAVEWTPEDNVALINLLIDHKAEAGEGGNFKKAMWVAVAVGMAGHPYKGGLKTLEACRTRWMKLRKDYNVALKLKHNLSGFTFLDNQGVVIDDESVWADFAAKNENAARVGRTRFPCFELMSTLMPSVARGTHMYRASTSTYGSGDSSKGKA
ncbi:hypothetical protein K439DRAFT_1621030 [Ramaria rubella]|nr:hypothetical protein K439DRAFT_1621030 [Ramaria rubella]